MLPKRLLRRLQSPVGEETKPKGGREESEIKINIKSGRVGSEHRNGKAAAAGGRQAGKRNEPPAHTRVN